MAPSSLPLRSLALAAAAAASEPAVPLVACKVFDGEPIAWPKNDVDSRATQNAGEYKVLMVRHAESLSNVYSNEFVASCKTSAGVAGCNHSYDPHDSPLTDAGLATARDVNRRQMAALEPPDVIFVSPMLRTMQTAAEMMPEHWLRREGRAPPKIYVLPWLMEIAAPTGYAFGEGLFAQPLEQDWGHAPSAWFNGSCPEHSPGATLDYNTSVATCQGYKGIESWFQTYVNVSSNGGYNGFYNRTFHDFWQSRESGFYSPPFEGTAEEHAQGLWRLINGDFSSSKILLVSHFIKLSAVIDWPLLKLPAGNPMMHRDAQFFCRPPAAWGAFELRASRLASPRGCLALAGALLVAGVAMLRRRRSASSREPAAEPLLLA